MSPIFELKLTPPTIELTPGAERPVDRSLLLDIAPDRESLIMGTQDVVKVREALAMKISDDEYEFGNHWLTKRETYENIKLRNVPRRMSSFGFPSTASNTTADIHTLLESFPPSVSASTASLVGTDSTTIINFVPVPDPSSVNTNRSTTSHTASTTTLNVNKPLPAEPSVTTSVQVLISPRPLGPTHTLLLYTERPTSGGVYTKVVEVPVNDLLVAVHCPNLRLGGSHGSFAGSVTEGSMFASSSVSACGDAEAATRIPYRQEGAGILPRMLLRVSDLATFPALVVYMHSRDRARLIKEVVGEDVWDIIKPFYTKSKFQNNRDTFTSTSGKAKSSLPMALALARLSYTALVVAGGALLALMQNVQDVGLRERALDADVDKLVRACVGAVNGKSRLLGTEGGEGNVELGLVGEEREGLMRFGDNDTTMDEEGGDREEGSARCWKLNMNIGLPVGLNSGWGWKLMPCIH